MKLAVVGTHPLLQEITNKFSITRINNADVVIVGGETTKLPLTHKPIILLSSYLVYCGVNHKYKVSEDDAVSIHPLSDLSYKVLNLVSNETRILNEYNNSLVLRTFPIYGHIGDESFIKDLHEKVKINQQLKKYRLGWRTRTFLYKDDFINGLTKSINGLLNGVTGLYNIGSNEEVTIQEAANIMWRVNNSSIDTIDEEWIELPWRPTRIVPNIERFSVTFDWKPNTSLSNGMRYLQYT